MTGNELSNERLPRLADPPNGQAWQAPADLEQELYELAESDDSRSYMERIAAEGVFLPVAADDIDPSRDSPPLYVGTLRDGRTYVAVYTAGVLPPPHPDGAYEHITLRRLVDAWPEDVPILAINPRTPCHLAFGVDDALLEEWRELHDRVWDPGALMGRLDTRRTGAPTDVATLRGLAAGALLCHHNGEPWNTLDWHGGTGCSGERRMLAEWWGISGRDEWQEMLQQLLGRDQTPWYWEFVLGARTWVEKQQGGTPVDPALWRNCVETTLRERAKSSGEKVDGEVEDFVAHLLGLVGKVLRYEARFRADGLLPPDGYVRSVAAWDLGRASCMARWGLGARYATREEMLSALLLAGEHAAACYGTWAEFSAGYVLGRCLHFDEEEFGSWYTEMVAAHRELITTEDGPWRTVPLR